MNPKRIEIYVGRTCNQNCTYCVEYNDMKKAWFNRVTKEEILKKLIKYKKLGYNHVTYLGGEPFIQPVFLEALKLAKKMGFTTLVTTNGTLLHLERIAKTFFPFIDELVLSVEAIDRELQTKISRVNTGYIRWDLVFKNIHKYGNFKLLKANIVITPDNINEIYNIIEYLFSKDLKDIALTYPDVDGDNLPSKDYIKRNIMPRYTECSDILKSCIDLCKKNNIELKLADFPFCVLGDKYEVIKNYISYFDDCVFDDRLRINYHDEEDFVKLSGENKSLPRDRKQIEKCNNCIFKSSCWGPSEYYGDIYSWDDILPIS